MTSIRTGLYVHERADGRSERRWQGMDARSDVREARAVVCRGLRWPELVVDGWSRFGCRDPIPER